jgi:signal transduction histidine kinase
MRQRFNTLRSQILGGFSLVIIISFFLLSIVTAAQVLFSFRQEYERWIEPSINLSSQSLEEALWDYYNGEISQEDLHKNITEFENNYEMQTGLEIATVIFDQPTEIDDDFSIENFFSKELEPLKIGFEFAPHDREKRRHEKPFSQNTIPLMLSDGTSGGYIQADIPFEQVFKEAFQSWASLFAAILIIFLIAALVSLRLSNQISQPLAQLSQSAGQLANGNLTHRIDPKGPEEVQALANTFNQMADSLEDMLEEQRAFASNASHELRTPVTNIRLRTEAILEGDLSVEETRHYIREMDQEAHRMSALIEDLILLSRFDAGRAEIGSDAVDLRRFAENQIAVYQHQYPDKFRFTLEATVEELPVRISLNHLTIVFRNLLNNAIKYSPEGGQIIWQLTKEEDRIVSRLNDNGMGIPPEVLPHLFERFYQGDTSHSREIPGSGLGLSLVKSIIEAYSGMIDIHSTGSGQGTTVVVRLPFVDFVGE